MTTRAAPTRRPPPDAAEHPLRAALYLRQSLDRAKGTPEEGSAIERQRQDCLALAKARGWQVVGTFPTLSELIGLLATFMLEDG